MKTLIENNFESLEDILFEMSLRSTSGTNIRVDDKLYNVVLNSVGQYIIEEFIPEFELTKEEFEKLKTTK
tara:strand:- start:51610 stop:51819 length:210 start_codon:yes stop_codon:yes gene_type:complete